MSAALREETTRKDADANAAIRFLLIKAAIFIGIPVIASVIAIAVYL